MVQSMGGTLPRLYLVGCEPQVLETDELGLSEAVQLAVPLAAELVRSFTRAILNGTESEFLKNSGSPVAP
jgi:hypothetical protein